MSFFQQISDSFTNLVRQATSSKPPTDVEEVNVQTISKLAVICIEDGVKLYKDNTTYNCVVHCPKLSPKAFRFFCYEELVVNIIVDISSLLRSQSESEAMTSFSNISYKLQPLYTSSGRILHREMLQQFTDLLRANPTWTSAHLAARLGLKECFQNSLIAQQLNSPDEMTQVLPIQVAVETNNLDLIKEFIILGAQLNMADSNGNNVYHSAAKCADPTIIQFLASKDKSSMNQLNLFGETALHVACLSDQPHNVEQLLRWGANPGLTMSGRYPIHCAMKVGSARCAEVLCRWSRDQIHVQDKKHGGTALHWARSRECVYSLVGLGANVDAVSGTGDTAIHVMVQRDRSACVMGLLAKGASAEIVSPRGTNAIHMAIQTDNLDLVEMLIVFGADINCVNENKQTPRHLVANSPGRNKNRILFLIHAVGAMRCPPGMPGCSTGCSAIGHFDGEPPKSGIPSTPEHQKKVHDEVISEVAMAAAMTRSASAMGSVVMGDMTDATIGSSGDRVLSLDGGGIRGLILIQLLLAIERAVGQPIRSCFDWIAGTSTGGILALAIVHGKTVRYCQGLYFQLKDEVFKGSRPYSSEPLENFLKKEFGENTRMNDIEYPRTIVTGVLADRNPSELHLFRNYDPPGETYPDSLDPRYPRPPRPNEQYIWRAARSTGAAPTYFRAFGRFLDGGLIANNPSLDLLTEINDYNMRLRATNQSSMVRPIHVVVSLGTGRIPPRPVNAVDVYKPEGLFDIVKVATGAKNLGQMLVETCTQSEGQPVERSRAWCSSIHVPFYRLSPQLSDDIGLDCRDDQTLIHMLWETQCYIHRNEEKIVQLATLLQS